MARQERGKGAVSTRVRGVGAGGACKNRGSQGCFYEQNPKTAWFRLQPWGSGYEFLGCTHWAAIYELGGGVAAVCPAGRGGALVRRLGPLVFQFQGGGPPPHMPKSTSFIARGIGADPMHLWGGANP